jgi:hypothetical protein
MWRDVDSQVRVDTKVSEQYTASIFKAEDWAFKRN